MTTETLERPNAETTPAATPLRIAVASRDGTTVDMHFGPTRVGSGPAGSFAPLFPASRLIDPIAVFSEKDGAITPLTQGSAVAR